VDTQPSIDDLLDAWEDAQGQGRSVSAEELCRHCPALLPELQAKIAVLKKMDRRLNDDDATVPHLTNPSQAKPNDKQAIPLERPKLQTQFEGLDFHAQGGLGMVFAGSDVQLHRRVALKFMHQHLAEIPWARERFLLEAEITGRLDHPGIVPVHGVGITEKGRPFYAMRFIKGETLDASIAHYHRPAPQPDDPSARSLEFRTLLTRFVSVCNTLAYAHNCGIVHRDIKPENIMLGRYAETLVVDWGLALAVDRDETARRSGEATLLPSSGSQAGTSSGGPAGTPAYMSPEQADDCDHVDRRADVYSLGVMLYKILCGKVPYQAPRPVQILELVKQGNPIPPKQVNSSVPSALSAVCLRAMAKEPNDRYQTALDLAKDIENWLADEPVSAYQEPGSANLMRWVRKHRVLAMTLMGSLVAFAILASIAAVGLGTYAQNESQLRTAADAARQTAEAARIESLRATALLAAATIAADIDRRWVMLERAAEDQELIKALTQIDEKVDDKEARNAVFLRLKSWLAEVGANSTKRTDFDSLFLADHNGIQIARFPASEESIGKSYRHRDYFHGQGQDFSSSDQTARQPIQRAHLSTIYQSSSDKSLKVALSVPIWSDKPGVPDRRVLGVLGMSSELNKFRGILTEDLPGKQLAVLVDLRFDTLDQSPQRGAILHHSANTKQETTAEARLPSTLLSDLLKQGAALRWEWQQQTRGINLPLTTANKKQPAAKPLTGLLYNYTDPLKTSSKARSIAAFGSVWIPGRQLVGEDGAVGEYLDTGWIVIVEELE
jgi:eukaryotic-like serine/threonine-protein kinase